ncbi:hypothetical protein CHS0354_012582 [Potamilus streckersoni]|uniref:GTP-binding protein 8 n=1 Tax=Potamilus streckersoni TaxID=2493646 RepID=A0AAE0W2R8_9BIVA|nr:hypothetical protein CHS0354_012582 [Potamilus streckersoni]
MLNCFCKRFNFIVNIQRSVHSDLLRNFVWSPNISPRGEQSQTLSTTSNDRSPVLHPLKVLQPHVAVPLIPESSHLFDPSNEEIIGAQKIFIPMQKGSIRFLKAALYTEQLPEYDLPEVAFIGRSNVGKSSLIKALFAAADEELKIRTSKTPGQTKTLHFFQVGDFFSAVDMPGYGHNMPAHFIDSAEKFLKTRRNLQMTFLLVDGKIGMTPLDVKYFETFEGFNIHFCIVMTKIDKAVQSILVRNLMSVIRHREKSSFCFPQPFLCSSVTGDGLALLQAFIAYVTGNMQIKGL